MTEDDLLRRAGAGERAAFDAFVEVMAPRVWPLVRRLTSDAGAAEDAMQETFIAAWRGASSFRGDAPARAWLFGLARRQAARTWRLRAGEPRVHEHLDALAVGAGWGEDPEALVARAEDRAVLMGAIARLPALDQQLLVRCELGGEERERVADELGVTPGALRVRLHRARLKLMAALQEVHDG